MPMLRNIWWRTYEAAKKFTLKAGTIIFALSIILWALATFPQNNDPQVDEATKLEQSYLGRIGHTIQPAFDPLGFDWKISIGIVSAFPAREVIISTLGILYRTGEEEDSMLLRESMRNSTNEDGSPVFTPAVALSLMIFFALCSQCMSTLAIIQRELNSIKWPIFVFTYMTVFAYAASFAFYQLLGPNI
jgi:ferrous iron transport protein B